MRKNSGRKENSSCKGLGEVSIYGNNSGLLGGSAAPFGRRMRSAPASHDLCGSLLAVDAIAA